MSVFARFRQRNDRLFTQTCFQMWNWNADLLFSFITEIDVGFPQTLCFWWSRRKACLTKTKCLSLLCRALWIEPKQPRIRATSTSKLPSMRMPSSATQRPSVSAPKSRRRIYRRFTRTERLRTNNRLALWVTLYWNVFPLWQKDVLWFVQIQI